MKRPKKYKMPHRRRREKRTDYRMRLDLLKSGKLRFVVRKSNNNIVCQLVEYNKDGDKTVVSVSTNDIRKFGWKLSGRNSPASYLVGYLCGKKGNKKDAVLDLGLNVSTKGSVLYAALKGALDAGMKITHSKEILPDEKRIKGKHISNFASKLKKDEEEYKKKFSSYIKAGVNPEDITKHFEEVLAKIKK